MNFIVEDKKDDHECTVDQPGSIMNNHERFIALVAVCTSIYKWLAAGCLSALVSLHAVLFTFLNTQNKNYITRMEDQCFACFQRSVKGSNVQGSTYIALVLANVNCVNSSL